MQSSDRTGLGSTRWVCAGPALLVPSDSIVTGAACGSNTSTGAPVESRPGARGSRPRPTGGAQTAVCAASAAALRGAGVRWSPHQGVGEREREAARTGERDLCRAPTHTQSRDATAHNVTDVTSFKQSNGIRSALNPAVTAGMTSEEDRVLCSCHTDGLP